MPNYIKLNFDYSKDTFLTIFNNAEKTPTSPRRNTAKLPVGIATSPELESFFTRFPFIQQHDDSIEIFELTSNTPPRINENNNGSIIFPLSGAAILKNYDFKFADPLDTWAYAIKQGTRLTSTMINDIEETLLETVVLDSPYAFNGQITHSYQTDGVILLSLHIPLSISWEDVLATLSA